MLCSNSESSTSGIVIIDKEAEESEVYCPSGVRLAVIDGISDSIVIAWFTDDKVSNPKVVYSKDSDLSNSKEIEATRKKSSWINIYTAEISNLDSNEKYYYQVSSDEYNKKEIMHFTTLPNDISNLKFVVIGDSQANDYDDNIKYLIKKVSEIKCDFYIHLGDVVDNGYEQEDWNEYFEEFEKITAYKVGFYVEGNHDRERDSKLMYDNIPMIDPSYSYNFDNLMFLLGLNTYSATEDFIDEELKEADAVWKISISHEPIFSTYIKRFTNNTAWANLYRKYGVDMVLGGHNHAYERQFVNNTYYILCPSIGDHNRNIELFQVRTFTQILKSFNGYLIFEVNRKNLSMQAFGYEDDISQFSQKDELIIENLY